jgi:hypothetical protein
MIANMRLALVGALVGAAAAHPYSNTTTTASQEPHVTVTTEVVTAITTFCPGPTTITHGTKTYTVTEATTLTITDCPCTITHPVHPQPTGPAVDECAAKCTDAHNKCVTTPGSNKSTCAAEFAECLGYNPYEGEYKEPTACSTTSGPKPTQPTKPTPPTKDECAAHCTGAFRKCQVTPGSNKSTCAANYAQCLGFNPFSGNGTLVEPTACSSPGVPKPTPPTKDECAAHCTGAFRKCQVTPGSNKSTCAANYAQCLGFNPFNGNGTHVEPTACSSPGVPIFTTETVTTLTTYCPGPTTFTHGTNTYTVTAPTTLTITDCPCTVTRPVEPVPTKPVVPGQPEQPEQPHQPEQPEEPEQPEQPDQPGQPQPTAGNPQPTGQPPVEEPSVTPIPSAVPGAANKVGASAALLILGAVALL